MHASQRMAHTGFPRANHLSTPRLGLHLTTYIGREQEKSRHLDHRFQALRTSISGKFALVLHVNTGIGIVSQGSSKGNLLHPTDSDLSDISKIWKLCLVALQGEFIIELPNADKLINQVTKSRVVQTMRVLCRISREVIERDIQI